MCAERSSLCWRKPHLESVDSVWGYGGRLMGRRPGSPAQVPFMEGQGLTYVAWAHTSSMGHPLLTVLRRLLWLQASWSQVKEAVSFLFKKIAVFQKQSRSIRWFRRLMYSFSGVLLSYIYLFGPILSYRIFTSFQPKRSHLFGINKKFWDNLSATCNFQNLSFLLMQTQNLQSLGQGWHSCFIFA